jgi:hypothetical protein
MRFLLWSLFISSVGLGFAQDDIQLGPKKYLIINPTKSSISLTDIDKRQIEKIILKSCTKQTVYQVAMGEIGAATEAKLDISHVSLVLEGKEQELSITATLVDENKKILLNKVRKSHVQRQEMLRSIEDSVEELFKKKQTPVNQ